jgi:hypothetical protein
MTLAEIQQAVGANPALLTEIAQGFGKDIVPIIGQNEELTKAVLPILTQKGFIVRSKDDDQSFLNSYKTQVIETEIPLKVKEVHDAYDRDFEQLFGEKKQPTEKTYNAFKRKIEEIKSAQISDPVLKEQFKTLQDNLKNKEVEFKNQIGEIEQKYFKRELDMLLVSALNNVNIALPAHLKTDEEKQKYVSSQKSMMKRDMLESLTAKKDNEGNIVFYNGDKPLTSTADGKALQAFDIIKERYDQYLSKEEGSKQHGAGTGKKNAEGKSIYQSKEDVYEAVKAMGFAERTKAFTDEYAKLCTQSGLV